MCSEHSLQDRSGGRATKGKQTGERRGSDLGTPSAGFGLHWQIWRWLDFPDLKPGLPCAGPMA